MDVLGSTQLRERERERINQLIFFVLGSFGGYGVNSGA